ncbi:MAG TPA: hypothetical protein VMI54_09190 [Polyangiaceae bacterium]|nr:hypothetical protein [Polyangiaceae bacterium]
MKRVFSCEIRRTLVLSAAGGLALLLLTLGGCSGTTNDTAPPAGTGGTTAAAAGKGGSAGSAVTAGGSAGSAGTGVAGSSGQQLVVNCTGTTYQAALSNCTLAGCHSAIYPASGMNLTPDSGLVGRLKDVPAKHADIFCEDIMADCTPATCPAPGQALLVNSTDYTQSWILKKIAPGDPMCGSGMPGTAYKNSNDMACIQAMVQAIATLPK